MADEEAGSSTAAASSSSTTTSQQPGNASEGAYSRLAELMGEYPDLAIYRKFNRLDALNLLFYQAELVYLEEDLRLQAALDRLSGDSARQNYSRNWWLLHQGIKDGSNNVDDEKCDQQWQIFLKIRVVLEKYSKYRPDFTDAGAC